MAARQHVFCLLSFFTCTQLSSAFNATGFTLVNDNDTAPPSPEFQSRIPDAGGAFPCDCGIPDASDRIVGGVVVTPRTKFPWVVAIVLATKLNEPYCGGALISDRYVITALHCFSLVTFDKLRVRIGIFDIQEPVGEPGTFLRKIKSKEQPSKDDASADIAVLLLEKPVTCGPTVRPICVPPQGVDFEGDLSEVVGWGETEYRGNVSRYLQSIQIPVVSTKQCKADYKKIYTPVGENMLCAGYLTGQKDACSGDSGGPLMYLNSTCQRWQVIGLVSKGTGCATRGFYGLYANVSYYSDFICKVTTTTTTNQNNKKKKKKKNKCKNKKV